MLLCGYPGACVVLLPITRPLGPFSDYDPPGRIATDCEPPGRIEASAAESSGLLLRFRCGPGEGREPPVERTSG
eukprot:6290330-Alexandrium_andersonii.AAC.1